MSFIDAHTRVVTLLGYPIEHTLSPLIHNTAFQHQQLNFVYTASAVHPKRLNQAVAGLSALNMAGANVTIPHKEKVLPLLDELTKEAQAIKAVNTIIIDTNSETNQTVLRGDNTDISGFLKPLETYSSRLKNSSMVVFGSGGAARAVVYALLTRFSPEQCTIVARTPEKAEQLAQDLSSYDTKGSLQVCPLDAGHQKVRTSQLLVNATPVGMHPNISASVWPYPEDFHSQQIAYDLVYRPRKTAWLQTVEAQGGETIGGLEMLIGQAAASYYQWTNKEMPLQVVQQTVANYWNSSNSS